MVSRVIIGSSLATLLAVPVARAEPAHDDLDYVAKNSSLEDLQWYRAWAHAVRLDVGMGRWTGKDLGPSGLALQIEWWPRSTLSFTTRAWMHDIRVLSRIDGAQPAYRDATGVALGLQVANPGKIKILAGTSVGLAIVQGAIPPASPATPLAGVTEAHVGLVLMARPVTAHVMAWAHLYSEGPPVFSLSFGVGAIVLPDQNLDQASGTSRSPR